MVMGRMRWQRAHAVKNIKDALERGEDEKTDVPFFVSQRERTVRT